MNYSSMRFTPTKRLRRERACSVGCARQSCLARWSPRSRRRTKRKRVLHERLPSLLTSWQLRRRRLFFRWVQTRRKRRFYALASLLMNQLLAAPESTAVATMWGLGGSSFISQAFLLLDAQKCSMFGDVNATFMEQNWGGWTGSVFHSFPRNNEAFGATLEVRRTADPRLGFGLFWWENGSEQVVSCSKKARSSLPVVNCAKWLEYLRQTCA